MLEEKTIRAIPVLPFSMMLGLISAAIGLIIGIIYALLFGAIMSSIPTTNEILNTSFFKLLFGVGAIILMPIIGFIGGFIQGVIVTVLYNFLAPIIGGIKLRFKEENYKPTNP